MRPPRDDPPNVVLVFTDQQSHFALGAAGNPHLRTPHLDALARRGTRFDLSYCSAPVCGPARAALVTGRPPHQTGVRWNGDALLPDLPTLGRCFEAAGYETAWCGKWHIPESYVTTPGGIPGFRNLPLPANHPGLARSLPYGWPGYALGANTDGPFIDQALTFLDRAPARPFLLCVSLHNPHDICWWLRQKPLPLPPPGALPPLPSNFNSVAGEPAFLQACRQRDHYGEELTWTTSWRDTDWQAYLHAYYRMTEEVDGQVGRLLAALQRPALADRTVVLFTSDHGEGMAAHRWLVKLAFYEPVVRVPMILAGPGVPEGQVDESRLTCTLDVVPTLCEAAGIQPPAGPGRSLWTLARDRHSPGHSAVVCELSPDNRRPDMEARMVRTERFKYCAYAGTTPGETLHDLHEDPGETCNLAANPAFAAEIRAQRAHLASWCASTGDPFTIPAPDARNPQGVL